MSVQEMSVQEDEPLIKYTEYELTSLPSGLGIYYYYYCCYYLRHYSFHYSWYVICYSKYILIKSRSIVGYAVKSICGDLYKLETNCLQGTCNFSIYRYKL